jgi:hypothetical protein
MPACIWASRRCGHGEIGYRITSGLIDFASRLRDFVATTARAKEPDMSQIHPSAFLRNAILLDAAASGATALLLIAGAGLLDGLLGLPVALMREAGLILVPYVAFVAWVGTRATVARGAVWTIIAANAAWTAASFILLLSGWVAPTALGVAFVIAQALAVALLGELQYMGLRRTAATA